MFSLSTPISAPSTLPTLSRVTLDSVPSATSLIFIALAILIIHRLVATLVVHPLAGLPGPWYAAVGDWWLTTHVMRLEQCNTIHTLFETYGPVVRVGPNKVVFRDAQTARAVYGVHKFDKSAYYKSLLCNDNDHAMTTLEHAPHVIRRKGYAPHYTFSNLVKFQPEIYDFVGQIVQKLHGVSGERSLECLSLFRHLMVDVLISSYYGYQMGAVSKWAADVQDPLIVAIGDFPKRGVLRSVVPSWAWNLVCRFPNQRWRQLCDSDKIMAEFVSKRVYDLRSKMTADNSDVDSHASCPPSPSSSFSDVEFEGAEDKPKVPMLQRLLQHKYSPDVQMPDTDIISEAIGHMIAGSDTTSLSIAYFLWELTRRGDILSKLREEIDDIMPDEHVLPDIVVLQKLPYLNAFIKEGLRLYGAAPSLLERVVPSTASKHGSSHDGFDLMGYELPPGTVVATQAWSQHRNPSVFPSPETFLPERWLPSVSSEQQLLEMSRHMMAFGMGSRVCGGQNLAHIMLRVVLCSILRNFDVTAPAGTDEKSMKIMDSFVIFPASMECKLVFTPRKF